MCRRLAIALSLVCLSTTQASTGIEFEQGQGPGLHLTYSVRSDGRVTTSANQGSRDVDPLMVGVEGFDPHFTASDSTYELDVLPPMLRSEKTIEIIKLREQEDQPTKQGYDSMGTQDWSTPGESRTPAAIGPLDILELHPSFPHGLILLPAVSWLRSARLNNAAGTKAIAAHRWLCGA